jgi:hypothetical protein
MLKNRSFRFLVALTLSLNFWVSAKAQGEAEDLSNSTKDGAKISGQDNYDAAQMRNPFLPLVTRDGRLLKAEITGENKNLNLEGIIYDKSGLSFAMINGQAVKIGDSVNDYRVLRIDPDRIVLLKDGETLDLVLKKEE